MIQLYSYISGAAVIVNARIMVMCIATFMVTVKVIVIVVDIAAVIVFEIDTGQELQLKSTSNIRLGITCDPFDIDCDMEATIRRAGLLNLFMQIFCIKLLHIKFMADRCNLTALMNVNNASRKARATLFQRANAPLL